MKIFVGTLYSGENEFEECVAAINSQTFRDFDHYIYKDLPNKEAHVTLFKTFLDRSDEYDLLIKVDADMVITSTVLFEDIVRKMIANPGLEVLSIGVHDFFSGQMINGLNTYRNSVRWNFEKDTLFVDIPETSREEYLFDEKEFAPAAIHCKNPSSFQSFHFGVHRGIKSIAKQHSTSHWILLEKTWKNFLCTQDVRIGLAVLGAEMVYAGDFTKKDVDYTNPRIQNELNRYEHLDSNKVQKEIKRLRIKNWGFLPGDLRRRLLRQIRGKQP